MDSAQPPLRFRPAQWVVAALIIGGGLSPYSSYGEDAELASRQPPRYNRMPTRPAWHVDVTDALSKITGPVSSYDEALEAEAAPYAEALGRAAESARRQVRGKTVWWRGQFKIPLQHRAGDTLVLEIDFWQ